MDELQAIAALTNALDPFSPIPPADQVPVPGYNFDSAASPEPPNFPPDIQLDRTNHVFKNWSWDIQVNDVWIAIPKNGEEVCRIANWAVQQHYKIRALGQSHNWSPLIFDKGVNAPAENVLLVGTFNLRAKDFIWNDPDNDVPVATFQTGLTILEITDYLSKLDNKGHGSAPGFSFINMTCPGDITLGGALAIGAHGTSLQIDANPVNMLGGCLSNLVLSFKAIVTDTAQPGVYIEKEFKRSHPDSSAFLVHLGRAFITEVQMRVVPNYYLNQVNHFVPTSSLFCAPRFAGLPRSRQRYLESSGRVEVIWFPGTQFAWVKTWEEVGRPVGNTTEKPFNEDFTFVSESRNRYIRKLLKEHPAINPIYFTIALNRVRNKAYHQLSGTSQNMLLYVRPDTLRVTALGYAIQIRRSEIQESAHLFIQQFHRLMGQYLGKYPISGAIELRYTNMDLVDQLGPGTEGAKPPSFSASASVAPDDPELDTVFWADILSIPDLNEHTNQFFAEMEAWVYNTWGNRVRPEWSKGWGFNSATGKAWS